MPEKKKVLMDTESTCFLCLKWVVSEKSQGPSEYKTFPYKQLSRYLCLNLKTAFGNRIPLELNVKLCPDCFLLAEKFTRLYKEKELIRLQITACVKNIHDVMTQAGRVRSRVKHYKKLMKKSGAGEECNVREMENLRKETIERCILKVKQSKPRVCLKRLYQPASDNVPIKPIKKKSKFENTTVQDKSIEMTPGEKSTSLKRIGTVVRRGLNTSSSRKSYNPATDKIVTETSTKNIHDKWKFGLGNKKKKHKLPGGPIMKGYFRKRKKKRSKQLLSSEVNANGSNAPVLIERIGDLKNDASKDAERNARENKNVTERLGKSQVQMKKREKSTGGVITGLTDEELAERHRMANQNASVTQKTRGRPRKFKKFRIGQTQSMSPGDEDSSKDYVPQRSRIDKSTGDVFRKTRGQRRKLGSKRPRSISPDSTSKEDVLPLTRNQKRNKSEQGLQMGTESTEKASIQPSLIAKNRDQNSAVPIKRSRGRPRKTPITQQPHVNVKPLSISLPRLARTVVSKYKKDAARPRAQPPTENSKIDASDKSAPATLCASNLSLFSCTFCVMKFATAAEVRKHVSKFHYCQLYFSSLKDPNQSAEEFKIIIDSFFQAAVKRRKGRVTCPYCRKFYIEMRLMRGHVVQNHYQRLKEDLINKTFTKPKEKKEKKKRLKSPEIEKQRTQEEPLLCQYCKGGFNNEQDLRIHTAHHHCDELFASFKTVKSVELFNRVIVEAFENILSFQAEPDKPHKCCFCPSFLLPKNRNYPGFWRLHVIDNHFQDFASLLGPLQLKIQTQSTQSRPITNQNILIRDETIRTHENSLKSYAKPSSSDTALAKVPATATTPSYMQNIGSSVDKNGQRIDFYYCSLCKKTIDNTKVEIHQRVHSKSASAPSGKNFECKYCHENFKSNKAFQFHSVDRHCPKLLMPYRISSIPEDDFPSVIDQNLENLVQVSGITQEHLFKCNFCNWTVTKDKSDSLKKWSCHLIVDHFEDFTNKLVELQKDIVKASVQIQRKPMFPPAPPDLLKCDSCFALFPNHMTLASHRCGHAVTDDNVVDIAYSVVRPSTSSSPTSSSSYEIETLSYPFQEMLMKSDVVPSQPQFQAHGSHSQEMDITHHYTYEEIVKNECEYLENPEDGPQVVSISGFLPNEEDENQPELVGDQVTYDPIGEMQDNQNLQLCHNPRGQVVIIGDDNEQC